MDQDIKDMLALKAGDREAFNRLLDKYERRVINFIFRFTGNWQDAEDLGQDTFLRVYNAAASYVPSAKFTTWLYRIASNIALDYLRKNKRSRGNLSLDEQGAAGRETQGRQFADEKQKSPGLFLEDREIQDRINRSLMELPDNQRAAIILKIYEERPYSEIAAIIGVSVPAVESLLFRARKALKNSLKDIK